MVCVCVCVCVCVSDSKAGLTYAECQVEQSHPDVQSEEQNDIGHFAEQDDVAHMLLHSYWHEHMRFKLAGVNCYFLSSAVSKLQPRGIWEETEWQ